MPAPKKWIRERIAKLDPHKDYAEIWRLVNSYRGGNDFIDNLIYCIAFPNFIVTEWGGDVIWRHDGGKVVHGAHDRVEQTNFYNEYWSWYGPHHERTKEAANKINQLHAHWAEKYPGAFSQNDDYMYVFCFSATLGHRLQIRVGFPGITEKEKIAFHLHWREMSKLFTAENGVAIHGYPEDFDGLLRFCEEYENRPRGTPAGGRKAVIAMHEQFVFRFFPPDLHWLGHQLLRSLTPATTLKTMQIEPAYPLAQEVLPKMLGLFLWYQETFADDPEQSVIEKREALSDEEREAKRRARAELDKGFREHFRRLYGDDPEFAGCPFNSSAAAQAPTSAATRSSPS
jgi:hypothetical protein